MIIKIIIERAFKEAPRADDIRVLNELRVRAMGHEGYVSGETLVDVATHGQARGTQKNSSFA